MVSTIQRENLSAAIGINSMIFNSARATADDFRRPDRRVGHCVRIRVQRA